MSLRTTLFSLLVFALASSSGLAQSITDVEAKPYGSYTGGPIDTVDLATGNLMLNIPLVSFPQRGSLPPLSFSVELNNSPYSQTYFADCDPSGSLSNTGLPISCQLMSSRYDTSPPGAVYQYQSAGTMTQWQQNDVIVYWTQHDCYQYMQTNTYPCSVTDVWGAQNSSTVGTMGAYITSSFEGGIVKGQFHYQDLGNNQGRGEYVYSAIDPAGTTHELESDSTNWNTYRAPDGSGYTFIPDGSGNAYDIGDQENAGQGSTPGTNSVNYWITDAAGPDPGASGLRLGTLYSPMGIRYRSSVQLYAATSGNSTFQGGEALPYNETMTPRALITTETDPSNNTITRGPWYWSGYWSANNTPFSDIASFYGSTTPGYTDSVGRVIPDPVVMQTLLGTDHPTASFTWQVPSPDGRTTQYIFNYIQISNTVTWDPSTAHSLPDPSIDILNTGWAISSIALPNGTQWTFTYGPGGVGPDLTEITTPTGGTISYTYTTMTGADGEAAPVGFSRCNGVCHAVQTRTETDGTGPGLGHSWTTTYTYGVAGSNITGCPYQYLPSTSVTYVATTTVTDPAGNDTAHDFCGFPIGQAIPVANQYHEVYTEYLQGHCGNLGGGGCKALKGTSTYYPTSYQTDLYPYVATGQNPGLIDFLPQSVVEANWLGITGVTTLESRQYSQLFTAVRVGCQNGCGPTGAVQGGSPGLSLPVYYLSPTTTTSADSSNNVLRTQSTTYEFQSPTSSYMSANLIALPLSEQTSKGSVSGTTTFHYDENNGSPQGAYGNLTSKTESYSMGGSTGTQTVYNSQGMPTSKTDGDGYVTTINYDSSGMFASSIQRPTTNSIQHVDYYSYDLNTGNLNWHTDENGTSPNDSAHTTTYLHDIMGRITSIQYPDGGGTAFCYTDMGGTISGCGTSAGSPPFSLYTSTTASPDPAVVTMHTYDGWGRQFTSSLLSDPLGATQVDTAYDFDGRVVSVSNPYRATPQANDPPFGFTVNTYDALGRKTLQTQPDGSVLQWCYNGLASTGQANCSSITSLHGGGFAPFSYTDISDETGRHSQQIFDGLGQMGAVIEPDPGSGSLAMETDYSYDVFGDLLSVGQLGSASSTAVQRAFLYDMASRVSWACNPETISPGQNCTSSSPGIQYIYDGNSNLTHKTDNRGITINYSYDQLNRLLSKTYSNDPTGTASSCYQYDGSSTTNGRGRLAAQWTRDGDCSSSSPILTMTSISVYDAMGRLKNEQRCMGVSNCSSGGFAMAYSYDLAGKLGSYTSGFGGYSFANGYDAAGRLGSVTSTNGSQNTQVFSASSYTPVGALSQGIIGPVSLNRQFDVRQRMIGETDSGSGNVGNTPGSGTISIQGSEQVK